MIPDLTLAQRRHLAQAYRAKQQSGRARAQAGPRPPLPSGSVCPRCGANARNGCEHYRPAEPVAPIDEPRGRNGAKGIARHEQRKCFRENG